MGILNKRKGFKEFKNAWNKHDFYYVMSDEYETFIEGEESEKKLETIYLSLSKKERELANKFMLDISNSSKARQDVAKHLISL